LRREKQPTGGKNRELEELGAMRAPLGTTGQFVASHHELRPGGLIPRSGVPFRHANGRQTLFSLCAVLATDFLMADSPILPDPRTVRTLRDNFRRWMTANQERFQQRLFWLLENATDEHKQQVVLMCKILDKLAPDQREYVPAISRGVDTPAARPVNIVIGAGIERGPNWVNRSAGNRTINPETDDGEE
jgi:hypothetical protein